MVTDRSRSGTRWDRPWTRPLRLAWLSALLLGLVYMHGVNAESVMAHAAPGPAVPMDRTGQDESHVSDDCASETGSADADHDDDHHDDHDSPHPEQDCAAGQPQNGPGLAAPSPVIMQWGRESLVTPLPGAAWAGAESAEPASRVSTESTVLRI
ncbi:DUF6153 family protein [Streptomyces sp. 6N223]|uniref:DUF6153 family protein n=1 Tax=Streptomyces sp. 6N223 TaxID=3457412 RepID=UPI003FD04543